MPPQTSADQTPLLCTRHITKTFPGVVANDDVTLEVRRGEVHALLGENGAGKTTLMRVLYGLYQPDAGDIVIRGQPVRIRSPRHAMALGVGIVPQHFLLVHGHTVAENIALGLPGRRFFFPVRQVERRLRDVGERYGLAVEPRAYIGQLSPGEQQRVEILKALMRGGDILLLDEPTALLTPQEAHALFQVIERLRAAGHAIIFITHKLKEVMEIANRVTVLRRGRVVATLPTAETDQATLARLMVGQDVDCERPLPRSAPGAVVLRLVDLWVQNDRGLPALRGLSLAVHEREILGVAGVAGNGQSELVEVLTGLRQRRAGQIYMRGQDIATSSVRALRDAGVAHIPADRHGMGIVPTMSVAENLVLRRYHRPPFARGVFIQRRVMMQFALQAITAYDIATPGPATPAGVLSGGNMQKLMLARELAGQPSVIVAAHPTYGLDVGATARVHHLLRQQRAQGAAIVLVSEDLEEIIQLADRIVVLCGGESMGIVPAATAERHQLGLMMAGVQHV
jgi:simple sugar transport system ATP-binding protein